MKEMIRIHFGMEALEIKRLAGYDNANFLVKTDIQKLVFKTYIFDEQMLDLVMAECEVLMKLAQDLGHQIPQPVPFIDGEYVKVLEIKGQKTICRMLTFLDGKFLGEVTHTKELMKSIGSFLGRMDKALNPIKSYVYKSRKWEWDLQYLVLNKPYIKEIPEMEDRRLVNYFLQQFEEHVCPVMNDLPRSMIHNDANEWNLLVASDQVTGIIDFGDMAFSCRINELAITIVYACYDKDDPLKWAIPIVAAYHKVNPLEKQEVEVLYYLIAGRLITSVCNSAHAKLVNPDNSYAGISEKNAWKMLRIWLTINPLRAEHDFKKSIDSPMESVDQTEQILRRRNQHISEILSVSYQKPVYLTKAAFQYMYDAYGNTYLDAYNNIPHVGHCHPQVVEAGQRQMARLNTNTRYLYDQLAEYADRLIQKFPEPLSKVFFVNSGSAASDLAIRLAKAHTGFESLLVMEHGYHGNTQIGIDISDYKFSNPRGQGKKEFVFKTPIPDTYRGTYQNNDGSAGRSYARDAINEAERSNEPLACFITEPIVGCGGQVPLAKGYLEELYPFIRKQGGVCISDEVQTGFGRLGEYFWGFEQQEVIPDIVILGKPMGNGHPIGAVVCTEAIAKSFEKGVEFFSSFGGNPVSCAIGLAVLDVIQEEGLQENARIVGEFYRERLADLSSKYDCIGDVRGSGLFLGVELVDAETGAQDTKLAANVKNALRDDHIFISTDGPFDNVLKTKPPLVFNHQNVDTVVDSLDNVLRNIR